MLARFRPTVALYLQLHKRIKLFTRRHRDCQECALLIELYEQYMKNVMCPNHKVYGVQYTDSDGTTVRNVTVHVLPTRNICVEFQFCIDYPYLLFFLHVYLKYEVEH